MTQIKVFRIRALSETSIESCVNQFLQEHAEDEIVNIQCQAGFEPPCCIVMVTYRTK